MRKIKIALSGMFGNALEIYDFALYGCFAATFAALFFPEADPNTALLASFSALSVGYFARPLGAILFGHLGDRFGRKSALTLSIIMMSIPTVVIGILPTYSSIGFFATILLVVCRLFQGLSAGGEYNGASIFLIEHLGKKRECFAGSLVSVSGGIGGCLALFTASWFVRESHPDWFWRIPFFFGIPLGIVGYYIRKRISETPDFQSIKKEKKIKKAPLLNVFKNYTPSVLYCIGGAALSGAFSSTAIAYLPAYFSQFSELSQETALFLNGVGVASFIIMCPIMGMIADRVGKEKIMLMGSVGLVLFAYPMFQLAQSDKVSHICLMLFLLHVTSAAFIPNLNAFMNRLFPANVRYSGVAFGYGMGLALFGGGMPMVSTFLIKITNNPTSPAFYLMLCGIIGSVAILLGKKHQNKFEAENSQALEAINPTFSRPSYAK